MQRTTKRNRSKRRTAYTATHRTQGPCLPGFGKPMGQLKAARHDREVCLRRCEQEGEMQLQLRNNRAARRTQRPDIHESYLRRARNEGTDAHKKKRTEESVGHQVSQTVAKTSTQHQMIRSGSSSNEQKVQITSGRESTEARTDSAIPWRETRAASGK